jgi:hypothetical protein
MAMMVLTHVPTDQELDAGARNQVSTLLEQAETEFSERLKQIEPQGAIVARILSTCAGRARHYRDSEFGNFSYLIGEPLEVLTRTMRDQLIYLETPHVPSEPSKHREKFG